MREVNMIIKFLNWIIGPELPIAAWKQPYTYLVYLGTILFIIGGCTMLTNAWGISLFLEGILIYVLIALSALNYENEQFGSHEWLKKKIF